MLGPIVGGAVSLRRPKLHARAALAGLRGLCRRGGSTSIGDVSALAPPIPAPTPPQDSEGIDPEVTAWLAQLGTDAGGAQAQQQVYALLYGQLHRAARGHMRRESPDHTLGPTALVHEAWFRMADQTRTEWRNRSHFMAVASTMMRRILVDHALARRANKRAAALEPISTTLLDRHGQALDHDVVSVHEALLALQSHDPRAAKVVELKFFGGLEIDEIAQAMQISSATVKRDWTLARAWLRRELGGAAE